MNCSLQLEVVVDAMFQKFLNTSLVVGQLALTAQRWLKQTMPTPFSRLFLTDAGISEKRYPAFLMDILLMTACSPRTEESTLESQPLVRQAINSHPKQVDQIGKTFPFLFSFIAYLTIQSAFLVHKLFILMASPPPGKSTPLSLGSRLSKQLMFLVKEKMGTT